MTAVDESTVSPVSGGGGSGESATVSARIEPLRVRGTGPSGAMAPTGPSGEREFFAERLAFFARIACLASSGFVVMRLAINAYLKQRAVQPSLLYPFPYFHLTATAILFLMWMLAGSRALSDRGLRRLDAAGTIGAGLAYAMMESTMPLAWRPDQLVLLILNAVLLGRAALVPSAPRRTAWISAASVAGVPIVTFFLYRRAESPDFAAASLVTQATLWASFTVVIATVISNVTFHLRRSVARARRLGQYTLLEKIGEGGMGVVYRAEHEMLRRPTAIKLLPLQWPDTTPASIFQQPASPCRDGGNPRTVRQTTPPQPP